MNVILPADNKYSFSPCVATVGIFDGVHAGHRFLMEELKLLARERNLKSVVITFAGHPRKVLNPDFRPEILTTLSEKIALLGATGIDTCIVVDFTAEMALLSAYEFIKTVLYEKYQVQTLLVGHDHRFGHNRKDGFPEYKHYGNSLGMEVFQSVQYKTNQDQYINSTEIRLALQSGDIEKTNRLLTYPYSVSGKVVEGFRLGRKIGFPTANLAPNHPDKLIPANGVYAVKVRWNNHYYMGMLNIGNRPTVANDGRISIEVHILDFNEDIYDQEIEIIFIQKIRDEKKFNSVDELTVQLQKDKNFVIKMNK
ncbi:MAG: bifunctional riboflavin kinase/FAD synthetase [Paludibacter sp.]